MERYTEKHYDGNGYYLICSGNCETINCVDCDILGEIVDRLAAYEDTGLEPEEIEQLKGEVFGLKVDKQELEQYRAIGPIDRLAAYEDTGLEPEDFKRSFDEDALLKLTGQFLGVTPDRLRELTQADRDGKLPKYTIGDIIYDHFGMAWTVDSLEYVQCTYEKKWLYRCGHPETDDYRGLYQDEVLTRAEAAAALRREQDG